jgi:membrane protein DedA with SNARE-associated domain
VPGNKVSFNSFPRWLQYTVASVVMGGIAAAGYFVGHNNPVPLWINQWLIPVLGWLGLLLIIIVAVEWIRQRR